MKKYIVVFTFLICSLLFSSCQYDQKSVEPKEEVIAVQEDGRQETTEENPEPKLLSEIEDNETKLYPNSKSVIAIPMGPDEETVLCKVKVPISYRINSVYVDKEGNVQSMEETGGKVLSDVLDVGSLEESKIVPSCLEMLSPGDGINDYVFAIVPQSTMSLSSLKESEEDGVEIKSPDGHRSFVCSSASDKSDFLFLYELNQDYVLTIEYNGQLKKVMKKEEFARECFKILLL